jgi:hypothetical protein
MRLQVSRGPDLFQEHAFEPSGERYELTVGADASCDVVLSGDDVLPVHAHIELRGWHAFVTPVPGAEVHALGSVLAGDQSWRLDDNPFRIGDYTLRLTGG